MILSDTLVHTFVSLLRLGVDDVDGYEQLKTFVQIVSKGSPVTHFIVHARKCFLAGLNPHQDRTVPPLRHEWVYSLRWDMRGLRWDMRGLRWDMRGCNEPC